ncbi:MAG TPA: NAD(P)/FAD-dependent oxidoreductase, partial [Puia sp.]|nr:NAD(P)/FAD-dependent oxidoreductase [Puia sp.]
MKKKALIIGAGPAGLTAAYELLKRTAIQPVVLERSGDIGGLCKTVNYKGNRIDIGGHRFFSKSDRVMAWWLQFLPLENAAGGEITIQYQNKSHTFYGDLPAEGQLAKNKDKMMMLRKRLSRIYFMRKFFNYPLKLTADTLRKLGLATTLSILASYLRARLFIHKSPRNLEDFFIKNFGSKLYHLFFKDYTEKVWGVPCHQLSAEWGAQRIKGVSVSKAIGHALRSAFIKKNKDIRQKDIETSLIEKFMYPKLGPGQLWEEVAMQVEGMGGQILLHHEIRKIHSAGGRITGITSVNTQTGEETLFEGDYFFSTMPIRDLIGGMSGAVPGIVKDVAEGLQYRDFITVGLLLKRLSGSGDRPGSSGPLSLEDTWIYIQDKDVKAGRLQIFNNWSPFMVKDPSTVWVGMEYFCNEKDDFWNLTDDDIKQVAISELEKIGL